jgi:DNA primase
MAEQVDLESLDGRVRFAESVKPYIGRLPDGLLKKMLWRSLAERSGVALEDLDTTIIRRLSGYRPNPRQHQKLGQHPVGRMTPLRQAVALLLNRPQLALLPELPEEWVAVKVDGIDLLNELMTLIQRSPDMDVGRLLEHWRDSELFRHLHTLSVSGLSIPEEGYEAEFRDCLARLEREARQQEFSRLTTRMAGSGLNEEEIERVKQLSELIR